MIAGDKAPNFTLRDHTGRPRALSEFLSVGPVVLFFFPIASSPICTAQACHFRDLSDEFAKVGAQRIGISTNSVDRQAHFAQQRSFDYPLLSDSDGVVSELFGVRRGRFAKLRGSVVGREENRHGQHTRRRGLLARLLPVKRATFVIDTDRTVLKVVSSEVRASVHADQTLWFLASLRDARGPREDAGWFSESSLADGPARSETLAADRIDSGIEMGIEASVGVVGLSETHRSWPKHDVREQILGWSAHRTSVAELAARLALPLGATRFLVDDLVTQGYLRVHAPLGDSIEERRELLTRTLNGLRAL